LFKGFTKNYRGIRSRQAAVALWHIGWSEYRAVCRARSKAEFVARIGIVAEEADESVFWIELIEEMKILDSKRLQEILKEARELAAIFSASQKTAKGYG